MHVKLFCFPYAGGSATFYNAWKAHLNPVITLRPVELAGRGTRVNDPLYKDISEAVNDLFLRLRSELYDGNYAFYGHSMGALISYELAMLIRKEGLPVPEHVFFSGKGAPNLSKDDEKLYHLMNPEDFKREVMNLGGTPPEFFDYPELLELFIPLLRNDFKLSETYQYPEEIRPFDHNISVLLGKGDDLTHNQCMGWKGHTDAICYHYYFEGGHFFLNQNTEQVCNIINNTLTEK